MPWGQVDAIAGNRITGWAFATGGARIEAHLDGRCVAHARPYISRPDVANEHPRAAGAAKSGFTLDLPEASESSAIGELRIVARGLAPWSLSRVIATQPIVGENLVERLATAADASLRGPFPKPVIDAIAAYWPEDCADLVTTAGQMRMLDRVLQIMDTPQLSALPAFAGYARYLTTLLAHCRFVERHFPATNTAAKAGANDFHCKPNSVTELFAIIHQLYVLKSWGVSGDFAEFGCFKGYSSSMLSFACAQLGIRMHVFDSFAGLPAANGSGYEAGQYAGSLDEVRGNIQRFGSLDAVEFHPGFFSESLRDYRPPALMCLWMDVDLELSSHDLMVVADQLDPRASIFSHECLPDIFQEGRIVTSPSPDNPVWPLVMKHEAMGRTLTGHHVAGFTGAFWPTASGTPVLDSAVLQRLMKAFR